MRPQITVLDAGGQYCHLIARKVRELGVYAEVAPSETHASELLSAKGVIISGGPSSVYDSGSPTIDRALIAQEFRPESPAVLGICYGQQLIAYLLGGNVQKGLKGEYGLAHLEIAHQGTLFAGITGRQQVWMSHRDLVAGAPDGFSVLGSTETCSIASIENPAERIFAVQFHPEVVHTLCGRQVLENFVFGVCGCEKDWDPTGQIALVEEQIRETAGDRRVFFFVSGGVDSTVAYTLCLKALGPDRVHGVYVDTGLMREGETEFVRDAFAKLGATAFQVHDAKATFLDALAGVTDPEKKRHIIGEAFVTVQEQVLESEHFLSGDWILGQGTIYPDTIESGGDKIGKGKAEVIKTHHNRVAGIQKLIAEQRIVEPLSSFYKDEVREIGRELGIDPALLSRHPFPGPGLAIRCLCTTETAAPQTTADGWIVPIKSVGVQGDSRTYRPVIALEAFPESDEFAADLINRIGEVNRVVVRVHGDISQFRVYPATLTATRLDRLRRVDAIVRNASLASGFDDTVWQFPVVLIPFGTPDKPDSVVLRPIHSVDGMTANAIRIPDALLSRMVEEVALVEGVAGVFCDLTNKPPGTIEWE